MRTARTTIGALLAVGSIGLATALPASAQPTCFNGTAKNFGGASASNEIRVRSCRAFLNDGKMREYGFIRIGPQATTATDCALKIRTGVRLDSGNVTFDDSPIEWRSCRPALRTGKDFVAHGGAIGTRTDNRPQLTEFCFELRKGGQRMSGSCLLSQPVRESR
jgi:hypothetical protein